MSQSLTHFTREQLQLIDLISKMIDIPLTPETREIKDVYQAMTQVPWCVERALVVALSRLYPDLIRQERKWSDRHQVFKDEKEKDYAPGRTFEAVKWHLSRKAPLSTIVNDLVKESLPPGAAIPDRGLDLEEFYSQYPFLLDIGPEGQDVHYAERQFLVRVFFPTFGKRGLRFIKPQVRFTDSRGKERFIDFVVEGGKKKFAIEIEGADFHAPGRIAKEKHEDDTIRQGDLTRAGYIVERIAAQQIFDESRVLTGGLKDRLRDLLFQDEPLKASLAEGGEGSDVAEGDKPALEAGLLHLYHIPKYFRPLQLALFYRLVSDRERLRDEPVVLFDKAPVGPLLPIALHELLTLVHQTETPYGIELGLPRQYRVLLAKPLGANCRDVWAEYLRTCEEGLDAAIPYGVRLADCQAEELELSVGETVIEVNLSSSFRGEIGETAESCERISILAKSISPEEQLRYRESLCIPQNALRPLNWHKRTVDYFVRRFFSIPALHRWQWEILTKTVKGEDVFGIMPTGSGKSLCYQLPAMILPGNVLVISPLRSLMRDQIANLRDYGFNRADYIASDIPSAQKDQNLEDFLKGALQLLYISPERVQIKSFLEDICERAKYLNISCVAVDEAHCVSEWGHDFRPSYLRIPRFVKEVLRAGDRRPPILAITATASPPVERDVRTILGIISDDQLIKAKSIDRSNLSFSVHCVDEDAEKLDVLRQVLTKEVPKALKIGFEKLIAQGEDYEHSGVVFAIYASPEGKSTYRDGIGAIFDHLTGDETVPRNLCRLHSSGVPKRCPNCHHFTFHHVTGGSTEQESKKYRCEICRAEFESPEKPNEREWEQEVKKNQEDFKHSRFPVLIATKGYGMGVDKRNIRYIIHHGFSSSLEAYYQEAGRAGRDDEHSHCAIVSSPPHTNCELDYFGRHDASVVSQKYAHIIF